MAHVKTGPTQTFREGDPVPRTGDYTCRTCAAKRGAQSNYNLHLVEGEHFPACPGCSQNPEMPENPDAARFSEFSTSQWELVHPRRMP